MKHGICWITFDPANLVLIIDKRKNYIKVKVYGIKRDYGLSWRFPLSLSNRCSKHAEISLEYKTHNSVSGEYLERRAFVSANFSAICIVGINHRKGACSKKVNEAKPLYPGSLSLDHESSSNILFTMLSIRADTGPNKKNEKKGAIPK